VPAASPAPPGSEESVRDIATAFPGAEADSTDQATQELLAKVPANHSETRELVTRRSVLPESLKKGWFGPEGWVLPETRGTVRLDVTKDGSINESRDVGPGIREYEEADGVQTLFQALPGKTVRIYKLIGEHREEPGAPTKLQFSFEKGCQGGGWFSSEAKRCATEYCTGWFFAKDRKCMKEWELSDGYSYLGHPGIALINPNERSEATPDGKIMGFLTAPVARDANRKPVPVEWKIVGDSVDIEVYDGVPGIKHPVVVDPHWFVGRWLIKGAVRAAKIGAAFAAPEVAAALIAIGCGTRIILNYPDTVGQPWYRRVWHAALKCLEGL
jgi:hypothetical protein